ncbi:hypothetical protein Ddye_029755 [Dipteronia dyeriana]|uniref:DUF1985 domain-containing protein n=1 Tax=Dipteronia dyeriana TaxID=168575 RepID=A0AAD9TFQ7_9ROSI|nr:hypothetical protein Ddye_029755 [Dipteronia dyeriana]
MTHATIRNRLKDLLKTPEGNWYEGKLTRHDHFDALGHIDDALNRVSTEFDDEDRCQFMASCFGYFLIKHQEMKFSGCVIHRLLLRELHHNGPTNEMQFMLGNQSVRMKNDIHQQYFPRADEVSFQGDEGCSHPRRVSGGVRCCEALIHIYVELETDEGDDRFKIPVWQFRLVEDLDVFDAFPWGAHIFAFEVILALSVKFGTRRVTDMSPRVLKWELSKQPRGKKMTKIFKVRMFARMKPVPTPGETEAPYYKGLNEGASLYVEKDRPQLPPPVINQTTFGGNSGAEGGVSEEGAVIMRNLSPRLGVSRPVTVKDISRTLSERGISGFSLPPPDLLDLQGIPVGALNMMER